MEKPWILGGWCCCYAAVVFAERKMRNNFVACFSYFIEWNEREDKIVCVCVFLNVKSWLCVVATRHIFLDQYFIFYTQLKQDKTRFYQKQSRLKRPNRWAVRARLCMWVRPHINSFLSIFYSFIRLVLFLFYYPTRSLSKYAS